MKKLLIIAALLSIVTATGVHASKETFSGTMCQSVYNVNSVYGRDVVYQYGAIWNRSSTVWAYVDCPVPRANGLSSGTIADLEVSVKDTDGNMWCQAINRDRHGNVVASETISSTGLGNRVLDFSSVAGVAYEGHITVFCVIPKNGGKVSSIVADIN